MRAKNTNQSEAPQHPFVSLGGDYEWGTQDYILAPFGFTVGALGALP